jgi:hypothetical protein
MSGGVYDNESFLNVPDSGIAGAGPGNYPCNSGNDNQFSDRYKICPALEEMPAIKRFILTSYLNHYWCGAWLPGRELRSS